MLGVVRCLFLVVQCVLFGAVFVNVIVVRCVSLFVVGCSLLLFVACCWLSLCVVGLLFVVVA